MKAFLGFAIIASALLTAGCERFYGAGSGAKIVNGAETGDYPAVVRIVADGSGTCTATFVSDSLMITAAHCILNASQVGIYQGGKMVAYATNAAVHPQANGQVSAYDLGVLKFPAGTSSHYVPMLSRGAQVGDEMTIVGFGDNDNVNGTGSGTKRVGRNTVADVSQGMIWFQGHSQTADGSGEQVTAGSGDSGGPLFIDGALAGVTSGGGAWNGSWTSLYVDLKSSSSQEFLEPHTRDLPAAQVPGGDKTQKPSDESSSGADAKTPPKQGETPAADIIDCPRDMATGAPTC